MYGNYGTVGAFDPLTHHTINGDMWEWGIYVTNINAPFPYIGVTNLDTRLQNIMGGKFSAHTSSVSEWLRHTPILIFSSICALPFAL